MEAVHSSNVHELSYYGASHPRGDYPAYKVGYFFYLFMVYAMTLAVTEDRIAK
jgi:hypothetical protein